MQYYMLHKPSGCVSARRDEKDPTVMDFFPAELRKSLFAWNERSGLPR